ncbi:MAG TPA: sulfotransferase domain-containing protein [Gallionella sp.]|nr:sulfotransferase domain-containing protein [Gallionella sp.]
MIVFVAGMSRAGSMWTYNVVRAIYETRNLLVLPKEIPADEGNLITNALNSEVMENEVYCIKTHLPLKSPLPTRHEVKIICNIRDVRDAALSFMRFTHSDFEGGLNTMTLMMNITDHYLTKFRNNLLSIRYEDLTNNPQNVLEKVAAFLNIGLSKGEKIEILRKFSKASIQKQLSSMKKIKLDAQGQVENKEQQSRFETVKNLDGTYRVYDKTTAFQSDHITSTKSGEWKTQFGQNQIDRIDNMTKDWLLRYGYKV